MRAMLDTNIYGIILERKESEKIAERLAKGCISIVGFDLIRKLRMPEFIRYEKFRRLSS